MIASYHRQQTKVIEEEERYHGNKIRIDIETTWSGVGETEYFEVEDDAIEDEG
ncbi:hypothetical protein ENLAB_11280 [Enterococcus innesii]|uniref:Uncharacterized protein n=1 Tax=Enterococcus innesii TaxID=2839759 RepID=A0ABN6NMV9_9ENTE|nr:hypothetical protein ENLAB_11280 [Enterococcus innesii]